MKRLICAALVFVLTLLLLTAVCPVAGAFDPIGDGGWVLTNVALGDLVSVAFPDAMHGWVAGRGGIFATSDGGLTWKRQTTGWVGDISFPDASRGWAIGGTGVYATEDGGATWTEHAVSYGYDAALSFADSFHGWIVGDDGRIVATSDGGRTWKPQTSGTTLPLKDVTFVDETHGCAVGGADKPVVLTTSDGGLHWTSRDTSAMTSGRPFEAVSFPDASHGWAVGDIGIGATTDGGNTWKPQIPAGGFTNGLAISFPDARHGWIVGYGGTIVATSDGGDTWDRQDVSTGAAWHLRDVCFIDATRGWAVGDGGCIVATNTGGLAPPKTVGSGAVEWWVNHPVLITLSATATTSPVASITYSLDGGARQTVAGTSTVVTIAADRTTHADDGVHTLAFTATDSLGLAQFDQTTSFKIDTRRPSTQAPYAATAARGRTATLKYKVVDARPGTDAATVTIKVRNIAGKVVRTLGPFKSRLVNERLAATFRVPRTWRAGTYRFLIYATDDAGNTQSKVGSNRLTVK
jgi:photosystem II stability/assembly factor-like uncharacterized protein